MVDNGSVDRTEGLGAIAGELLGDYSSDPVPESVEAPPESTPSPVESPEIPVEPAPPAEGEPVVEPTSTPSSDAPPETLDEPPTPVDPESGFDADPALTYTVNGEARTYDGIRLVDGAGYIKPSALADVQRKLGEREHLFDANQKLYQTTKQYDAALVYHVGAGDKAQELRGVDAFRQAAVDAVANSAAGMFLFNQIKSMFPNPTPEQAKGLEDLFGRAELVMQNAQLKAAASFGTAMQTRTAAAETAAMPSLDQRFEDSVTTIEQWAAKNNLPFSKDDAAELREIYGATKAALARAATAAERQKFGTTVIYDPTPMNTWAQKRVAANQARATTDKVVNAATVTNANRLATARAPKPVVAAPRRPVPVVDQRKQDADDAWDLKERLAHSRLAGAG